MTCRIRIASQVRVEYVNPGIRIVIKQPLRIVSHGARSQTETRLAA